MLICWMELLLVVFSGNLLQGVTQIVEITTTSTLGITYSLYAEGVWTSWTILIDGQSSCWSLILVGRHTCCTQPGTPTSKTSWNTHRTPRMTAPMLETSWPSCRTLDGWCNKHYYQVPTYQGATQFWIDNNQIKVPSTALKLVWVKFNEAFSLSVSSFHRLYIRYVICDFYKIDRKLLN